MNRATDQQVIVYVLASQVDGPGVKKVAQFFVDPYFHLQQIANDQSISGDIALKELPRIRGCFLHAQENHADNYFVIIRDDSTSAMSPESVTNFIRKMIRRADWDIFYLSNWQDQCSELVASGVVGGVNIMKTKHPHGIQALIISPQGRKILMGQQVNRKGQMTQLMDHMTDAPGKTFDGLLTKAAETGAVEARTGMPMLFSFDISQAKTNADYAKLAPCADKPGLNDFAQLAAAPALTGGVNGTNPNGINGVNTVNGINSTFGGISYFWWAIIIIAVILIIFGFCYYRKRRARIDVADEGPMIV